MIRVFVVLVAVLVAACGNGSPDGGASPDDASQAQNDDEPPASARSTVVFDGATCDGTFRAPLPDADLDIEVANKSDARMALIVGTYDQGYSHDDLFVYADNWRGGSGRPDFVNAVEIIEVPASSERLAAIGVRAGRYFAVCMAQPDTMIALDDFTVS